MANLFDIIVADSGPLIALSKLGLLDLLLRCFRRVYIPQTVLMEVTEHRSHLDAENFLRFIAAYEGGYIQIAPNVVNELTCELGKLLDPGETQAINLANSLDCPVLMDGRRRRMLAAKHGVSVFGLIGLLLRAKQTGYLPAVAPYLLKLKQAGYYLSDRLVTQALRLAEED